MIHIVSICPFCSMRGGRHQEIGEKNQSRKKNIDLFFMRASRLRIGEIIFSSGKISQKIFEFR